MSYFNISDKNPFGIVTVMDVKVFDYVEPNNETVSDYLERVEGERAIAEIDHMQVATLSTDGPSITINGGKYNNPLIKYGKTARCEMTDALGQADALVALGGAELDSNGNISITDKFGAPVTIIGTTFVVDQATGKHIPMKVVLYKFLPDSTPSFAFDSGNAATFDLNGDLLAVEGLTGFDTDEGEGWESCSGSNGVFFSMVPAECALDEDPYIYFAYDAGIYGPAKLKATDSYTYPAVTGKVYKFVNVNDNADTQQVAVELNDGILGRMTEGATYRVSLIDNGEE